MAAMELHRGRLIDHSIEAVFHGEAERGARWVKISF